MRIYASVLLTFVLSMQVVQASEHQAKDTAFSLTDEDKSLIEQGQGVREGGMLKAEDRAFIDQSRLITNHAKASEEAWMSKAALEAADIGKNDVTELLDGISKGANTAAPLTESRPYRAYIFISYSMSDSEIKSVLQGIAGQTDTAAVMRGIPDGGTITDGLLRLQGLAKDITPAPNVILDPVLFRRYEITAVPALVVLDGPGDDAPLKAKVMGSTSVQWLEDQVAKGVSGNLGVRGPTLKIAERDLIEVMQERAAAIDWEKKKEEALGRFWSKQRFFALAPAVSDRARLIDPTINVTEDIKLPNGKVLAKKGDTVNPLEIKSMSLTLVVFDPMQEGQLGRVRDYLKEQGDKKSDQIVYIATQFERDKGWDGYRDLVNTIGSPVFLLGQDVISRFQLEYTPSVVEQQGKKFSVREFRVTPNSQAIGSDSHD